MHVKNNAFAVTLNRIIKVNHPVVTFCFLSVFVANTCRSCESTPCQFPVLSTHNFNMLQKVCTDIVQIKAHYFEKPLKTGCCIKISTHTQWKKIFANSVIGVKSQMIDSCQTPEKTSRNIHANSFSGDTQPASLQVILFIFV